MDTETNGQKTPDWKEWDWDGQYREHPTQHEFACDVCDESAFFLPEETARIGIGHDGCGGSWVDVETLYPIHEHGVGRHDF